MRMRPKNLVLALLGFAASCALPESAPPPEGGADSGGTAGLATGGSSGTATGGTATGGTATGGTATGGTATGGTATGGTATGGTATGGTATGGTATGGVGGSPTGGTATGGTAGGGAPTGGTGGRGGAGAGGAGAGGRGGTSAGGAGAGGLGGAGAGGGGAGGSASGSGGTTAGGAGAGPVVELARDKSATADSEENNPSANPPKVNLAPNANDGSATTRWCAANGGTHYWQVDLGASHSLSRVEIDFEYPTQAAGASYGYLIGVSPDGTTFTTAIDRSANTSTTAMQTATFPASTAGRYVRVTVNPPTTTPQTWSSFWEVRIYGR
jgi:hypothetical protein